MRALSGTRLSRAEPVRRVSGRQRAAGARRVTLGDDPVPGWLRAWGGDMVVTCNPEQAEARPTTLRSERSTQGAGASRLFSFPTER